ncbi:Phthalate 4,5-dioxygenase [Sphingobium chlorophenolicum L-1]|uniref:Phthalate 4,5-dioxygenase n=1 Tax=Sphingobium chlorophenolicum L-1 TaxID=690566 RepID=F6EWC9_SPHCR|nr:PDR/VanB family oxidoreductase [Sphingobium chlorophenolicum]AEG49823.1 Phthalate 4,5-dioxygenase [Sphingobium chlorophenolicum L-1]
MSDWISVRVAERREEADGVVGLILAPTGPGSLPAYEPGAHIDLKLPNGLVRQYSLCGPQANGATYELGILHEAEGRGGSRYVHEHLAVGEVLEISAPRNLFPLVPGQPALLFAGGIGITPILSMADELARQGLAYELHYCTRSATRAAFRQRIGETHAAERVHFHYDDEPETRVDIEALLSGEPTERHIYVCGPNGFMDFVLGAARARDWPEERLHSERFSGAAENADGDAFEIEIAGTGQVIHVPAGLSATAALAAAGIEVPLSCEQGICGTCLTTVLSGVPDHRDMYLSPAERAANDCFTPCCSRALTARLIIDL